jgi:hypothetical protein
MAKRKQVGGQLEGRAANCGDPSPSPWLSGTDLSNSASGLTTVQAARLRAMQALAEILVTIFLELPSEEQAKYQVRASGDELRVV